MFDWIKSSKKRTITKVEKKKRRYHLGLDWGTSSTKIILRDLQQMGELDAAYVLSFDGCDQGYRYPSLVAINKNRLAFGSKVLDLNLSYSVTFPSLKSRVCNQDFLKPLPQWEGLSECALAILFLTHVISLGKKHAEKLARKVKCEPQISLTLGVPVAELEHKRIWSVYYELARISRIIALEMDIDPQSENIEDALTAINVAYIKDKSRQAEKKNGDNLHMQYLRPEVAAAMYWSMRSPVIETGLYSCVDVGAWTTNASFYRLADRRLESGEIVQKDQFSFYGGRCNPPGMDSICKLLCELTGEKDFTKIRGQEASLINNMRAGDLIDLTAEQFYATWKKAFQASYPKEKRQGPWEELKVMVIGGGSRVPSIRRYFERFPGPDWKEPDMVPDLGLPKDLYEYPGETMESGSPFCGDCTFALVAYGLSVPTGNFPRVLLQDMVSDWSPEPLPEFDLDRDDIYTD